MGHDEIGEVGDPGGDGRRDRAFALDPAAHLGLVTAGAPGQLALVPADDDEAPAQSVSRHRKRRLDGRRRGGVFVLNTGARFRGKEAEEVWQGIGHGARLTPGDANGGLTRTRISGSHGEG